MLANASIQGHTVDLSGQTILEIFPFQRQSAFQPIAENARNRTTKGKTSIVKHLGKIKPSSEQLKLISANQTGAELIRGSAGSGKTTTALLRLKSLTAMMRARKDRIGDETPVRMLLLTFNRTLAGYVRALAESQIKGGSQEIEIGTFAKWSMTKLGISNVSADSARACLQRLANRFDGLDPSYVVQEAEYLLGRFEPHDIERYIEAERTGRGLLSRVYSNLRRRILDEVIYPYKSKLDEKGWLDWNSLSIKMRQEVPTLGYDIIVVDESQDFSANEIRAIHYHLADDHAVTFVIDTAQRIYAREFTWAEAGIDVTGNRSHRLRENHRNTKKSRRSHPVSLMGSALTLMASCQTWNLRNHMVPYRRSSLEFIHSRSNGR